MSRENNLGEDNIKELVLKIAIPSMLAQFISVFYSIIDRMYIGHIDEIGSLALGGVGVCGPILTMISSVAFLIGMGGSPLMSMSLGAGKKRNAENILSNCFMTLIVLSIILTIGMRIVKIPMLRLFGAGDSIMPYADTYFTIYSLGTVFLITSLGMNQFIIAQGFAKYGMISVSVGAICNIILDPIFIFMFDMGVAGAATATVISQFVSCIIVVLFMFSERAIVNVKFNNYSLPIIRKVMTVGLTPFIIIVADNLMMIALNMILQKYGGVSRGDILITCGTIAQSFMLVVTMPLGGITAGTQTILAYNYGAGKYDRVRDAQKNIFKLCIIFTTTMLIISRFASPMFVKLFTSDAEISKLAVQSIKMFTIAIVPLGIQYGIVDGFTALGQVKLTFMLSTFRKLVFFISLFILPMFLPIEKVFYAEAISDIIPPIFAIAVYKYKIRDVLPCNQEEMVLQKQ